METVFEKTKWFREREYGFFFHFLNSGRKSAAPPLTNGGVPPPAPPEEWNEIVDSFDVAKLAAQLHELNAGFAWLTIGQNSGYFCSPNAAYDRYLGRNAENSKCSRRDLMADFADALAKYDVPLLAYTTCLAPGRDHEAMKALGSIPPWNCNANCGNYEEVKYLAGTDPRLKAFLRKWNAMHREWSARWGKKVNGWWVDGAYFADKIYDFPDEPNGHSFADALRAGNPDALIAFNYGVKYPVCRNYPGSPESITAGEAREPLHCLPEAPVVDGLQCHVLTFAGTDWGTPPLRYTGKELAEITRAITDNGGVISWDLPFEPERGIAPDVFAVLKDFAAEYRHSKSAFPRTRVSFVSPLVRDGVPISGHLELNSEKEASFCVEWNGQKQNFSGTSGKIPLNGTTPSSARITCGGFQRDVEIPVRRKFRLSGDWSAPCINPEVGTYRFAAKDRVFLIQAEFDEPEPLRGNSEPWDNSSLNFFLFTERKRPVHYCFCHDGTAIAAAGKTPVPGALCRVNYAGGKAHYECSLPLPDEFPDKTFYLEIIQNRNDRGNLLSQCVFNPFFCTLPIAEMAMPD